MKVAGFFELKKRIDTQLVVFVKKRWFHGVLWHWARNQHDILYAGSDGLRFLKTDTVRYDKYGNPVSYGFNSYTYDYSRKAGQKFYADVFMGIESDFYLLQYLGFFPEINNPPNVRMSEKNSDAAEGGPLAGQTFDAQGKLTGFSLQGEPISISWNCSR